MAKKNRSFPSGSGDTPSSEDDPREVAPSIEEAEAEVGTAASVEKAPLSMEEVETEIATSTEAAPGLKPGAPDEEEPPAPKPVAEPRPAPTPIFHGGRHTSFSKGGAGKVVIGEHSADAREGSKT